MKKILTTSLMILLLISGPALASKWMVGGSIGAAVGKTDENEMNQELIDKLINARIGGVDNERLTGRLFVGYEFTPRWGVELGYVDLGETSAYVEGTSTGINNYFADGQYVYPQTAKGLDLSGIYRYPVNGMFQLTAQAGVYAWNSEYTVDTNFGSRDVSNTGFDLTYGLGVEVGRWIRRGGFVGQFNWNQYQVNSQYIQTWTAGVSYRF
jgi:hypothetical protein